MPRPLKAASFELAMLAYALYALARRSERDTALFVLADAVPMWARRIGGTRGPFMWVSRRLQRRWFGSDRAR